MASLTIQADSRGVVAFYEALSLAQKQRTLAPLERRLQRVLRRYFVAQSAAFLNRFRLLRSLYEAAGENEWGPDLEASIGETRAPLEQAMLPLIQQALALGGQTAQANLLPSLRVPSPAGPGVPPPPGPAGALLPPALDIGFDVTNPEVSRYLRSVGAERIVGIEQTTREEVRAILSKAADEGWSYTRTARELRTRYQEFAGPPLRGGLKKLRSRAELIAVTELGEAYEHATMLVAQELARSGVTIEKSWLAPANPCPVCAPNPGAGWIPLARAFPSGHQRPTAHPSCRCSLLTRPARTA